MRHDGAGDDERGRGPAGAEGGDAELTEARPTHDLDLVPSPPDDAAPAGPLGLIDRFRFAQLRSRKELEAVEIVLDARLDEMRNAAAAAARESKARWNARTADVVTALKTVVQAQLRGIENERMVSRFESIERAYEAFAAKVREVETGTLPDELRDDLVRKLREHLTATIARLENDAIADRYELKD